MNNVKVVLFHPSLDLVSDRTFRDLLKRLSSLAREIQAQEVLHLIRESPIADSQKQSLRDRLKPELNHIPAYYVESISRGSLGVTISLTAFGIWLLQKTVGKSIEEAWLKSEMHTNIVEYLTSERRPQTLERNVEKVIDSWSLDRFLLDSVQCSVDDDGDIVIEILLETPEELELPDDKRDVRIDVDFVLRFAEKEIQDASKGQQWL